MNPPPRSSDRFPFVAVSLLATLLAIIVLSVPAGPSGSVAGREEGHGATAEDERAERFGPEDHMLFQRTATAMPTRTQLRQAWAQATRLNSAGADGRAGAATANSARWRFVGPVNIGARVTDLAVDPVLRDTIYVASASGGVWKSSDAGTSFKAIWPRGWVQSIGALAQASDGTLYVGTGETNPGGGSLTYGGDGVYRSTDRGKTWKHVGLAGTSTIGRIVIDPNNPNHVFVAASGNLFIPGGPRGLYETRNGGQSWSRILEPPNPTTGAVDIALDPTDTDNMLVAMWDHIRYPDRRVYAGVGSGIWRSTDGGDSFTRLGPATGLPPSSNTVGRIGLGIDPQDPQRVYAVYVNDMGTFGGWFASINGGAAWTPSPGASTLAASQSVYGWWFGRVWVDPADSQHLYVAGVPLAESTDGGNSFIEQTEQHVDHHAMAWDPHVPGRVYNGNDGGVYRSEDNGADGTWIHGRVQPWSQFFTIDVSEQDPSWINGGLQDQGSVRSWNGPSWNNYNGGDGVKNAINPTHKLNVFACSQYGSCVRSDNGGNSKSSLTTTSARAGWLTPIEFQPGNTDTVYWAADRLNKSVDRGRSWTVVSPDLGKGDGGGETNPLYANHYGTIQAVGLNHADPQVIYAGTDNALLWKTVDGGANWTELTPAVRRWVTHIEVKRDNPNVVYMTFSGYRSGDHTPYVVRSTNGGATWTDISANLPQAPVNDLVLVRGRIYVATDLGVFTTRTSRIRWAGAGSGFPQVVVTDLRYVPLNGTLYAGTFGRGIWSLNVTDV